MKPPRCRSRRCRVVRVGPYWICRSEECDTLVVAVEYGRVTA